MENPVLPLTDCRTLTQKLLLLLLIDTSLCSLTVRCDGVALDESLGLSASRYTVALAHLREV